MPTDPELLLSLTADIVSAHVGNNSVSASDVPMLIQNVFGALQQIQEPVAPSPEKPQGAVSVRASIKPDYLVSMIDGKQYKMLRRHLSRNGYTPESYREAFGLPKDYPMVAAGYAARRSELAITNGLGRKPKVVSAEAPKPTKAPRARKLSVKTEG